MDTKQLVTIAVTAAVSVIAKEAITWLFTWAKTKSTSETSKAVAKKIFSKNNRRIMWDVLCLSNAIFIFLRKVHETSPISRLTIVGMCFWTANVVFWCICVFKDVLAPPSD
jgi:hypothetical protein